MSEEAVNVQRKTFKELQKAWTAIAQEHFKNETKSVALEAKQIRGCSRPLNFTSFLLLKFSVSPLLTLVNIIVLIFHHPTIQN